MDTRRTEKWHVGKEIPIALILAMLLQTGGWIWWAATMSAKMDSLSFQVASLTSAQYTQTDATKDHALWAQQISDIDRRLDNLEGKK